MGYGPLLVESLQLIERELTLFTVFWFIVGMIDELVMDVIWLCLRLDGRRHTMHDMREGGQPLKRRLAVFVPAWREADVIGATVGYMLQVWPQRDFTIYAGCYRNDADTIAAVMGSAGLDTRVRVVIHDSLGPTTKADCLNRLYTALCDDEARRGERFGGVLLHDSEDMVHPLELELVDEALAEVDFVQLPVRPEFPPASHWVAGHYCDEFVEAHAKGLVVRDALGAALPAAGVGCGFERTMLERIREIRSGRGETGPFAAECFTEDYELGLLISRMGGRSRFLRRRDARGELIGTRSYFPASMGNAVRQKTRWIHGIALQGWDRLGWWGRPVDIWMSLRDRRGPLTALVLAAAYALLLIDGVLEIIDMLGGHAHPLLWRPSGALSLAMRVCVIGLLWRIAMRMTFTTREYGLRAGLYAALRIPVANVITIVAGRRAFIAYCRSLMGRTVLWDKTEHHIHPAMPMLTPGSATRMHP